MDTPRPVDSLSPMPPAQAPSIHPDVPPVMVGRMKFALLVFLSIPYLAYVGWCVFLLSVLPSPAGAFGEFIQPGLLGSLIGACVLLLVGAVALKRIFKTIVPMRVRLMSVLRVVLFLLPGLILSGVVPMTIVREPTLSIIMSDPVEGTQLVAPLSITYSVELATDILKRRSLTAIGYSWDFDGDGLENDRTVVPLSTGVYERSGAYVVAVTIELSNGEKRQIARRITIPRAVFSYSPVRPGVDEPVRFSVEHLVEDAGTITEVQWDFNGDSIIDAVSTTPEAAYTYVRTGKAKVSAVVKLANSTQVRYEREIEIFEPQPPPFPVKIITEPENLIGPPPLGVIFRVETSEQVQDVVWDFGEGGEKVRGERVSHNFQKRGVFQVTAQVSTESGAVAELTKMVRVVDTFTLSDLEFQGTPTVQGTSLSGEVPVTVNLTPVTAMPLIHFYWEAPGATTVGSTETTLQAIYRRSGKFTLTLIAQDPDGKVMRRPLILTVNPPASAVSMRMNPDGGVAPLSVHFDASETIIPGEEITGFEWVFGDNREAPQQRGAQIEHTFEKPGTFDVELRTLTTSGKVYKEIKTIVIRAPILDACALPSRTTGKAPLGVSFDMSCTTGNIQEVLWDFGDGAQSDQRNPVHVFEEPGTFAATLKVIDTIGAESTERITITVEAQ